MSRYARLVNLWLDRKEPAGPDSLDILLIAERFANCKEKDPAALALAWRTLEEMYGGLGWEIPVSSELAACRSAADSARHTAWSTTTELLQAVPEGSGDILLLGHLGLAAALFGRPDVLPASGALLVRVANPDDPGASASGLAATRGIRWAQPGRLATLVSQDGPTWEIEGRTFRLPTPALACALTASGCRQGRSMDALLFTAAWLQVAAASTLLDDTAETLGLTKDVRTAAWQLGLGPAPGLFARLQNGLHGLARRSN